MFLYVYMIYLILLILLIAIMIFIFFKIFSKIIHTMIAIILLLLLVGSGIVFLAYFDYKDINENFTTSPNVIILKNEDDYLSGGIYILNNDDKLQEPLNVDDMESLSKKEILNNNYKLIFLELSFLEENMNNNIYYGEYTLTREEFVDIIESDNFYEKLSGYVNEDIQDIRDEEPIEYVLKAKIFSHVLFEIYEEKGMDVFVLAQKNNQMEIYKKSMFFRVSEFIPKLLLNNKDNTE